MTESVTPPTPAEADLRDFAFTPFYRGRLFGSAFHARANDAEWRAGVTLWMKAQDQVPAGSLPDDDVDLCRLAELGRDLKTWRKLKPMAMHGWYQASDGRLYHPVIAEIVTEQWEAKIARRNRTAQAREARLLQRRSSAQNSSKGQGQGESPNPQPKNSRAHGTNPRSLAPPRPGSAFRQQEQAHIAHLPPDGMRNASFDARDAWLRETGQAALAGDYGNMKYPKWLPANWTPKAAAG